MLFAETEFFPDLGIAALDEIKAICIGRHHPDDPLRLLLTKRTSPFGFNEEDQMELFA